MRYVIGIGLIALGSALLGSVVGYTKAEKDLEGEVDKRVEAEMKRIKAYYERRYSERKDSKNWTGMQVDPVKPDLEEHVATGEKKSYDKISKQEGYSDEDENEQEDLTNYAYEEDLEGADTQDEDDDEEGEEYDPDPYVKGYIDENGVKLDLYVVTPEVYFENEPGYDTFEFTVYRDGVVLEETGEEVIDPAGFIGGPPYPFGEKSDDPHLCFIRNDIREVQVELSEQPYVDGAMVLEEQG